MNLEEKQFEIIIKESQVSQKERDERLVSALELILKKDEKS